jgi:hypothetical protein
VRLDLEQEPFAPSGGIDGRAARRAMGKPGVEFWDLFLRETLQNSWDAKSPDSSSIAFSIEATALTESEAETLRTTVFADVPPSLRDFVTRLKSERIHTLRISDRRTRGLGGVTRADTAAEPNSPRDFVDFLRNVGRAASKTLGGGTYGFGKGVLYDASNIDTCLIYSQTLVGGTIENRFIASSVGDQFELVGRRYTGRHWWGVSAEDGVVDPLTGEEARRLAESMGLAVMHPDETGTVISVLDPRLLEDDSLVSIVEQVADAAIHWAWPHMVDLPGGPTIEFAFGAYGKPILRPAPSEHPILQHYVRAYERAIAGLDGEGLGEDQWPWTTKVIAMQRPALDLGVLAYRKFAASEDSHDSNIARHVALMREPRFVVKYLPVAEDPAGQGTAGVFIVNTDADDAFAKSEPVAHDDWVPSGGRSNPVKVALGRLLAEFKQATLNRPTGSGSEHASGVAQVSRMLGSVLSGTVGTGGEVPRRPIRTPSGGSGNTTRAGVAVTMSPNPRLVAHAGQLLTDFYFKISLGDGVDLSQYSLGAVAKVVLDGGAVEEASDRPAGSDFPEIYGWYSDGELIARGDVVPAGRMIGATLVVRVAQPTGIAITTIIETRLTA